MLRFPGMCHRHPHPLSSPPTTLWTLALCTGILATQAHDASYFTHYTNANAQLSLTLQTNQVSFGDTLELQAAAMGYIAGRTSPGPTLSVPVECLIDDLLITNLNAPWSPYGVTPGSANLLIRLIEGPHTVTIQHTNPFQYYEETIYSYTSRHTSWGSTYYHTYFNVFHHLTAPCSSSQSLTVFPPPNLHRLQTRLTTFREDLVDDSFDGNAGDPPDLEKFAINGEVRLEGNGTVVLYPINLPQAAMITPAHSLPRHMTLKFRAAGNYLVGDDGQPRGLRDLNDPNNAVEFFSNSSTVLGLRSRNNGILSLVYYSLPTTNNVSRFHDYEIQVTPTSAVFLVDGTVAGRITENIPSAALNFHANNRPPSGSFAPLYFDRVSLVNEDPATPALELTYTGRPTNSYQLEASFDLATWDPLQTAKASPDGVAVFYTPLPHQPRFYRACGP